MRKNVYIVYFKELCKDDSSCDSKFIIEASAEQLALLAPTRKIGRLNVREGGFTPARPLMRSY